MGGYGGGGSLPVNGLTAHQSQVGASSFSGSTAVAAEAPPMWFSVVVLAPPGAELDQKLPCPRGDESTGLETSAPQYEYVNNQVSV